MDNGGATFGGVSYASVGLLLLKENISLLPETVQTEEELDGLDGSIDIEVRYAPRLIEHEVMLLAVDEAEYQTRLQQIAKLLNARTGVKPLIRDRMTGKRWMAKYNGRIPIEKIASLGQFTIPYKAFCPFAESVTDSTTPLAYGQGYSYGMGLRYGGPAVFPVAASPTSLIVYQAGTHEAYPVIRLAGSGSNITISNTTTGETLTINQTISGSDVIEINCAPLEQAVRKNGNSSLNGVSGKFPRLAEGDNSITISGTGLDMTVSFIFRHTYLY
jgi:phage-related protein